MPDVEPFQPVHLVDRRFTASDQSWFAAFSGDSNPMHMDPIAARRTQAGAPVVHGVHLLLWALEQFCLRYDPSSEPKHLGARFDKFAYVDDLVELWIVSLSPKIRLELRIDDLAISSVQIECGSQRPASRTAVDAPALDGPDRARELQFHEICDQNGRLSFVETDASSLLGFPKAAAWLTWPRILACAATSRLVGMVCPGLHSIFTKLDLDCVDDADDSRALSYAVAAKDDRFRLVRLAVSGGGVEGRLETFARRPPQGQTAMASLRASVSPHAFAGSTVLVVGGSRGLGELTAKLIAAGGGDVVITYKVGREDAESVAAEIRACGGRCTVLAYDVGKPARAQLESLSNTPTHAYYFATPPISRRQTMFFDNARLGFLMEVYVEGFWRLCQVLRALRQDVVLFYPSSIFVVQRPPGFVEYAMAKAAGEKLCEDINDRLAPTRVVVDRLPRLATDQTNSLGAVVDIDTTETMLRVVGMMQRSS